MSALVGNCTRSSHFEVVITVKSNEGSSYFVSIHNIADDDYHEHFHNPCGKAAGLA